MGNNKNKKENIFRSFWFVLIFTIVVLLIGILGFYIFHRENWIDAFYNTAGVLSTIGTSDTIDSPQAKLFSGVYFLFVGLLYIFILQFAITSYLEQHRD